MHSKRNMNGHICERNVLKKKKKTPANQFLDLIFAITFLSPILAKCVRDEKYSETSPPTSLNESMSKFVKF